MPAVPNDMTTQELRAEILADVPRLGILPAQISKLLSEPGDVIKCQAVDGGGHNGAAQN